MVLGNTLDENVLMLPIVGNWRNTLVTASPFPDHNWLFIWLASALSSLFQPISFFLSQTTDWSW